MDAPGVVVEVGADGFATLTLDRPERHNAFDDVLVGELAQALSDLAANDAVRGVALAARGKSFSAGADLNWMKRTAGYDAAQNRADARAVAHMLKTLDELPKPTLALVQGPAYGGGVGLIACCDIAVAVEDAVFALTEVRLGLLPAVISPYVVAAIGARAARRVFLTAERFDAFEANRLGLVHEVVADEAALAEACARIKRRLGAGAPGAIAAAKDLIAHVNGRPIDDALLDETARHIAEARAGDEGKEGVAAFLGKRKPKWTG